jgi:DNA-binding PadR family transcriptional regulator
LEGKKKLIKSKGTRIVIYALTPKGREALEIQKHDEIALRKKYAGVYKHKIPLNIRNYLKTVSLFIPKDEKPLRHEILGFKRMSPSSKISFYSGVKNSFRENGCDVEDFEVKFFDE